MVDPFDEAIIERAAHGDVVEHREVLDVLAEPDAAGVRTDRNPELRREEEHGERFVHSPDPAGVQLAHVDGVGLEQLLEDDAVLDVLSGRDADRRDLAPDARVTQDVVGARRLLDPPGSYRPSVRIAAIASSTPQYWFASIIRTPFGPSAERMISARFASASRSRPTFIFTRVNPATVGLPDERRRSSRPCSRASRPRSCTPDTRRCSISASRSSRPSSPGLEEGDRLGWREGVLDVPEVDRRDELLGRQIDEEAEERLALALRPEVPDGVDDGCGREVDHALLGAEPAELPFGREASPEAAEVGGDLLERAADHEVLERAHGRDDDLGPAPVREGETVALDALRRVGVQDRRRRTSSRGSDASRRTRRATSDVGNRMSRASSEMIRVGALIERRSRCDEAMAAVLAESSDLCQLIRQ